MSLEKTLSFFVALTFLSISLAHAAGKRDLIIQQAMNCVDHGLQQNNGVSWDDVCEVTESPSQEHMDSVNQVMDQMEGKTSDKENSSPPVRRRTEYSLGDASSIDKSTENVFNSQETEGARLAHKRNFDLAFQTESSSNKTADQWPYYYSQLYTTSNQVKKNDTLDGVYGALSWHGPLYTGGNFLHEQGLPNYGAIEISYTKGHSEYSSYVTGKLKNFNIWNLDSRFLFGYDYKWNETTDVTSYLGFGYQTISDNDGGWVDFIITNYAQFTTITSMYYLPIGIETHTKLSDQWDINIKLEGDYVLYGTVVSHLNDISGTYNAIDFSTGQPIVVTPEHATSNLRGGIGFRTSVKLIKKYKYFDLYLEPFFKFLYLNKSEAVQEVFLATNGKTYVSVFGDGSTESPLQSMKNSTFDFGARMGVEF